MLLLAGVAFVDGVDKGILPGVLSLVQDDLGFSDTQAGVLGSVFVLMTFAAVLPAGYIADRFRRTSIIAMTLASWGLISAVNAAVRNFWQFVAVRAALGIGETVDNPASQSLISDYYGVGVRGRAFAYQRMAPTLGGAIGVGVGGGVGAVFGWRAAFLLVGVPGSLLALAIWRLREPARGQSDAPDDEWDPNVFPVDSGSVVEAGTRGRVESLRRDLAIALRVRSLRAVMVGTAVAQGATAGFAFWMPTYYERHTSLTQASAAAALGGLMLLGALAGTLVGGRLNDRIRPSDPGAPMALAGLSQLIAGVVIVPSFLPGVPAAVILAAHLVGTALLVGGAPSLLATLTEIVPARIRGISFAVATFFGALMAALSPLLIGAIADQFTFVVDGETKGHLGHAFLIVTPLVLIAGSIVLAGRRHVRRDVDRVPELDEQLRRGDGRPPEAPVDVPLAVAPQPERPPVERLWAAVWGSGSPWTRADVRTLVSTVAVGVLIFGWAWWEASGSADLDEQTGWLVVGVLAVIVVLKGMFSWVRTGWRQVRLRRLRIIGATDEAVLAVAQSDESSGAAGEPSSTAGFIVIRGSARYHREDCLLVQGKASRLHRDAARVNGLQPCEMCHPAETQADVRSSEHEMVAPSGH